MYTFSCLFNPRNGLYIYKGLTENQEDKVKKKAKIPRVTDVGCSCLAYAVEKKSKRMVQ